MLYYDVYFYALLLLLILAYNFNYKIVAMNYGYLS